MHPIKTKTKLYGGKMVSSQGRNYWNKLPSDIKEIKSINLFKKNSNNICSATTKNH